MPLDASGGAFCIIGARKFMSELCQNSCTRMVNGRFFNLQFAARLEQFVRDGRDFAARDEDELVVCRALGIVSVWPSAKCICISRASISVEKLADEQNDDARVCELDASFFVVSWKR